LTIIAGTVLKSCQNQLSPILDLIVRRRSVLI
jgi:hypothetical protein